MEILIENEDGSQSEKSGQEVAKNQSASATTHGSTARLKRRIKKNTRTYYGKAAPSQYLIRIQRRRHREWFELGPDLDSAAKMSP